MIEMKSPDYEAKRVGEIEVDEDPDFLTRSWGVQRIGWIVMVLIVGKRLITKA